ncbi:MAG: hypothetical protein MI799_06510 [Desulfobacterales bacterium]|nr:hypothetical protein [Desulfobacterales bacterium]
MDKKICNTDIVTAGSWDFKIVIAPNSSLSFSIKLFTNGQGLTWSVNTQARPQQNMKET